MAIIVDSPAHLSTKTAVVVDESRRPFYRWTPMPLLAWILSKLGLVDKDMLKKYRKYAVVVLLVLAAVITPTGDPFTLSLVFIPLYLLYELSIALVGRRPDQGQEQENE